MNNQGNQGTQGQPRNLGIQQAQIQQLARQCNLEIQEARKLGIESAEGQEHLKKAQRIKAILMQYQQQQQQKQAQQQQQSPSLPQGQSQAPASSPQMLQSPQLQQQSPQVNPIQQQRSFSQNGVPQQGAQMQNTGLMNIRGATGSPSPMAQATTAASSDSSNGQLRNPYQQLQQIKQVLANFSKKLKDIELQKTKGDLAADELQTLLQQESQLKERFNTYKNVAVTITQQLQKQQQQQIVPGQARAQSGISAVTQSSQQSLAGGPQASVQSLNASISGSSAVPLQAQNLQMQGNNFQFQQQSPQLQQPQVSLQGRQNQFVQQSMNQIPNNGSPVVGSQQVPKPVAPQRAQSLQKPQTAPQQQQPSMGPQSHTGTPLNQAAVPLTRAASGGASASPNATVTNVNAAAKPNGNNSGGASTPSANVFKSSVPSLPISSQVTPRPVQPVQVQQMKPSLTGGHGVAAPALTTPAMLKLPPYELQSDRVLSKRKLSELVKTVGADEGDGETTIDGDVEELLLDLADEFVTTVTAFACRLSKHRKADALDARDIQLHLEKNWNIRIPGYSSDEIRNVRKWQPSSAHTQRIHGIGISKSVEQNK